MLASIGLRWAGLAATAPAFGAARMSSLPSRLLPGCQSSLPLTRTFSAGSARTAVCATSTLPTTACLQLSSRPSPASILASAFASVSRHPSIPTLRTLTTTTSASNDTPTPTPSSPPPSPSKPPLSEDILTIPNLLTISRLLLTPYIGYLVATHSFTPACILLFVASLTDLLDGWLARRTNKYTVFGSIADPAADKALVTTMVVSLAWSGMLPLSIAGIILGRDIALVISAFVTRYRTLEPPKTLKRYWNPSLPSATVTPTTISKYNTFLQLLLLGVLTLYPILFPNSPPPSLNFSPSTRNDAERVESKQEPQAVAEARLKLEQKGYLSNEAKAYIDKAITALMWVTAATTVYSGVGYLGGAGTGKVLAAKASSKVKESLAKTKPPK